MPYPPREARLGTIVRVRKVKGPIPAVTVIYCRFLRDIEAQQG